MRASASASLQMIAQTREASAAKLVVGLLQFWNLLGSLGWHGFDTMSWRLSCVLGTCMSPSNGKGTGLLQGFREMTRIVRVSCGFLRGRSITVSNFPLSFFLTPLSPELCACYEELFFFSSRFFCSSFALFILR